MMCNKAGLTRDQTVLYDCDVVTRPVLSLSFPPPISEMLCVILAALTRLHPEITSTANHLVDQRVRRLIIVVRAHTHKCTHAHTQNPFNISGARSPHGKEVAGSNPAGVGIFLLSLLLESKILHKIAKSKQSASVTWTLDGCLSLLQQTGNSSRVEPNQNLHADTSGRGCSGPAASRTAGRAATEKQMNEWDG